MPATRSPLRPWLIPLGALLAGMVLGAGGRSLSPSDPGPPAGPHVEATPPSRPSAKPDKIQPPHPPYSSAAEAMADRSRGHLGRFVTWVMETDGVNLAEAWKIEMERKAKGNYSPPPQLELILIRWAELDPTAMLEATKGGRSAYAAWVRADPDAAVATAREALGDGTRQSEFVMSALLALDPEWALALAGQEPELALWSNYALQNAMQRLNPREAFFSTEISKTSFPDPTMDSWAAAEPEEALRWSFENAANLAYLHDPQSAGKRFDQAVNAIVEHHPEEAVRLAETLPTGVGRRLLLERHVAKLAKRNPEEAIALARSQEGPVTRRELLSEVGAALALEHPERSLELLAELMAEGADARSNPESARFPDGSGESLGDYAYLKWLPNLYGWLSNLAVSAPHEAMGHVYNLPDSGAKGGVGSRIATTWMERDERGYAQWLEGRPEGPQRDQFIGEFVGYLAGWHHTNMPEAVRWAAATSDESTRSAHLQSVLKEWHKRDQPRARAYLESDQAPAAARAVYETIMEEGPR